MTVIQKRNGKLVVVEFIAEKVETLARATRWSFLPMCLMLFFIPAAKSQLQAPIRSFSPSEHGAKRQTWDIAQAPDGIMAFANGAGLLLFDGVRWVLMPSPDGHTVRSVFHHNTSNSWVAGSYNEWYRWADTPFPSADVAPSIINPPAGPNEEWWHIVEDPSDASKIYVQTFSRMSRTTIPPTDSSEHLSVPGNIMFASIIEDTLYLPVLAKGLFRLENDAWKLVSDHPIFRTSTVVGLAKGSLPQELIVATREGSLFSLRENTLSPWPSAQRHAWSNSQLNKLIRLKEGGYALATIGNGVFLFTADGTLAAHLTKESGLADESVLSMFEDREGDLWLGLDNGIAHVGLSSGLRFFGRDLGTVYAIHPQENGQLLLGTNQGLYTCSPFQPSGTSVGKAPEKLLLSGQVWHITTTENGTIIGANDGTNYLDKQGIIHLIGTLAGGWCWLQLDDTTALAGTYAGIEIFSSSNGRWMSLGKLAGFDQPVQHLALDPEDTSRILANHPQEGLYALALNITNKSVQNLGLLFPGPGRLSSTLIGDSLMHDNETVTYYTESGAHHLGAKTATQNQILSTEIFKLPHRSIILEVDRLKHWNSSKDTTILLLTPNLEYPTVVAVAQDDSTGQDYSIALGLTRGIGLIETSHPRKVLPKTETQLVANDQQARTISFRQARFDEAPQWSVRLKGVNANFSTFSTQASYSYPLLPAGEYTLEWRNSSGQQGSIFWEIEPRWYESKLAVLAYLLMFGFVLWTIRFYYRRRLKNEARQAEIERVRQLTAERLQTRTASLEAEVEISKRTVALRDAEVDHRNRELARTTMTLVRQNETLLRLKESLTPLPRTGDIGKAKRQSIRLIERHLSDETDWDFFEEHFDAVHAGFLKKLHEQHLSLTPGDLRLAALLRLNLPSKEIAPLLHISIRGVENKRYRLRKKLGLPAEVNLTGWVIDFV